MGLDSAVRIRKLDVDRPDDVDQWRGLYQTVFGREYPTDVWRWKYLCNPSNPPDGPAVFVAESGGRLVAAESFEAATLILETGAGKRRLRAGQPSNLMTHPSMRGQGLFYRMTAAFEESAVSNGFSLAYGHPNANSLHGYRKMGWTDYGWLSSYATYFGLRGHKGAGIRLSTSSAKRTIVSGTCRVLSILEDSWHADSSDVFVSDVEPYAEAIEELCANRPTGCGICGERSAAFVRWRFARPDRYYRLFGLTSCGRLTAYAVVYLGAEHGSAVVKDFYAAAWEYEPLRRLFSGIANYCRESAYAVLSVPLLERRWPFSSVLSLRRGFVRRRGAERLIGLGLGGIENVGVPLSPDGWCLSQADISPF
jgi:GNAT superfamily N-acetyltransferase